MDSDSDPVADQIFVVTESGEVTPATGLVETSGADVTVIFDESQVEAAAAVIVGPGVVVDEQGDANPRVLEVLRSAGLAVDRLAPYAECSIQLGER